jgi:vacuolar-type H+-ATPase subunit F/Vma7
MNFFCIADRESALGFKFSGVETREVSTKSEAKDALSTALSSENVGIIIVTEQAASYIRDEISGLVYKQELPLILEVPSRSSIKKAKGTTGFLKEIMGVGI